MVDQRKKERQEAPGGGFNPETWSRRSTRSKSLSGPTPTDDPKRKAGGAPKKKLADAFSQLSK